MTQHALPPRPELDRRTAIRVREDFQRFQQRPMPANWWDLVRDRYGIDLAATYAGFPVTNPFGKASGQLSLNVGQVRTDAEAGLGFVVLKTVVSQDASGNQSMSKWAVPEAKMLVERILGADGTPGWTVTWRGRGWHGSYYLEFFAQALDVGRSAGMLVVPSCQYHIPSGDSPDWRTAEYQHTTAALRDTWARVWGAVPMPIEKDFSPTLAGDARATDRSRVLDWLRRVPSLIRAAAGHGPDDRPRARIGLKLMNALFDDDFQIEMIRAAVEGTGPGAGADWLTYANRLFGPERTFERHRGVAYGGPDLSRRNLRVLRRARAAAASGALPPLPPISAKGNILTGRTAAEYGLAGCDTFQMHTLFQLPNDEYASSAGNRTARALHHLLFHPEHGYIPWMAHLRCGSGADLGRTNAPIE